MLSPPTPPHPTRRPVAQDLLYTEFEFNETEALSLVQSFVLFLLGSVVFLYKSSCRPASAGGPTPAVSVPLYLQLALGASIAGNVLLTNYATEYLSFPVQVIFKSAKLLVAMAIRAFLFKKPNPRIDYLCATLLSLGLIGFMWPDGDGGGSSTTINSRFWLGLACVVGSLIAEAAMLNIQEFYLFGKYGMSTVRWWGGHDAQRRAAGSRALGKLCNVYRTGS